MRQLAGDSNRLDTEQEVVFLIGDELRTVFVGDGCERVLVESAIRDVNSFTDVDALTLGADGDDSSGAFDVYSIGYEDSPCGLLVHVFAGIQFYGFGYVSADNHLVPDWAEEFEV